MYTVQQIQALEYLLHILTITRWTPLEKPCQLVVDVDGVLWTGNFLEYSGRAVVHQFIDDRGCVVTDKFSQHSGLAILDRIWGTYEQLAQETKRNPFEDLTNTPILLDTLLKILDRAPISPDDSPFLPCLHNARTMDGSVKLPYLHLGDLSIRPVSIIESPAD